MGGEKAKIQLRTAKRRGSPPRGRGKGGKDEKGSKKLRITPAWAGKRTSSAKPALTRKDHPRVGGEKARPCIAPPPCRGSPPRGRGKGIFSPPFDNPKRITPAWAGKSQQWPHMCGRSWDHPRVGGEKFLGLFLGHPRGGSPPRGRGKARIAYQESQRQRITPAWAGKRLKRSHRSGIFISGPIPFHSVLHRPAGSGGSRAGRDGSPAGQPQNAGPA